ncbi:hypothetical protein ACFOY4_35515 [Actinomadura syzygii]|uniref:Uncharacterized protein n=1 Tax=Actinomadura syzygii TaxID=1427538 RepID=A0A5D0U0M7_9ACTN|nr:hypothetical protein [Actinomadura syzygii]TYC11142.1 hypothetical protein FXF65_29770 [Actinomadura syzygii]
MITVLVLVSLVALFGLCVPDLLRPMPVGPSHDPPPGGVPVVHPESMTAELDPVDEEYLAFLADELWPDDEYLEPEPSTDGEEESGGSGMLL